MKELKGVCTITLTPFDDQGNVDEKSLRELTDFYIRAGVDGMTILGIMGESHKLSESDRLRVMNIVLEQTDGRVPVVVGCSAQGTNVVAELAKKAEEAGAAAVMIAPPANLKNEEMLFYHYKTVADNLSIPIVVQDEPVTTGVILSPAFLARLADEIDLVRYVKLEEAPTTVKTTKILEQSKGKLQIFGGLGGMYFYEELNRGAIGIMTGFAYPEVLVGTYQRFVQGKKHEAREYFFKYLPLIRFEAQLGIGGVTIRKEIFKLRGIIESSHVRFPGAKVDEETMEELRDLIEFVGLSTAE
ncbi:dihydrodipicolinate synthase family protein [Ammoniphilus sp. CFH 90114]|uniref:dihydrodipicolinate synthase family protein n=1 Tax=Ammoniphilus sp. CFH 90114 TaxID=2493665 RepID=UPI00100E4AA0|nr:dihydrodipicolinate synthase family protein [Ammoniphilus sp. CFH 90114]RXT07101.1 dihydrodipicolinate synthase family protein [Ammoniphilus sp. CFH 90114]